MRTKVKLQGGSEWVISAEDSREDNKNFAYLARDEETEI